MREGRGERPRVDMPSARSGPTGVDVDVGEANKPTFYAGLISNPKRAPESGSTLATAGAHGRCGKTQRYRMNLPLHRGISDAVDSKPLRAR